MSQLSAINSVDTAVRSTPNQFSEMSSEDFIKIMFAELANQDPFEPSDSAALLQQLSSLRSIESDMRITDQLSQLVQENQLASAGNLAGKFVGGLTADNDRVAGWVVAVMREGNTINLELDSGWMIPIANVETIFDPTIFDDLPAPKPPSGGPSGQNGPGQHDDEHGENGAE